MMTSCFASQFAKKDYEWIKRRNTGVMLVKDPPIIKLERGEEIHLLRSIRELKMASSCGYQIVYLFLPYRVGFIALTFILAMNI